VKRKKKQVNTKKERVILSDVLPYEIPATFSNRQLSHFLIKNRISIADNIISWDNASPGLETIIKLLFGFDQGKEIVNRKIELKGNKDLVTIPFRYKVLYKEKAFRELVVIHPKNQLLLIEFYEKYKETILYYCNISPFSIRKPHKVAKFTYYNDRTHLKNLAYDHEHKSAEEFDKEYEYLQTFFAYKKYSNIYKFYESYEYHRCEKKYNKLFKFDIAKCFDSVYTHSLAWTLLNKEIVKEKIRLVNQTFGGRFDVLMQKLNHNETNGIIIGPEFSRIFAELILQRIDFNVMHYLQKKRDKHEGLKFKTDYHIFRYVDDFFVFYDDEETRKRILDAYRYHLMEYKLYINDSKSELLEKPIITGITIAKQKITDLLNKSLIFKISEEDNNTGDGNGEEEKEKRYYFYVSSNKLITRFKIIIKETGIAYKDILNYTLACIDRKVLRLINMYSDIENKEKYELRVVKFILELLDFTFFLYSVSPKVNTTIKLCLILSKLSKFTKIRGNFNYDHHHLIFKKIYDDISLVLGKNKNSEYTQVETLYLLIALKELGREYRLDESILCKYFGVSKGNFSYDLNYFSITVLLFYVENMPRYATFKEALKEQQVKPKFEKKNKLRMAEQTFLLLDILSCPYIDDGFKKELLVDYDIKDTSDQDKILKRKDCWFTKWTDFDFGKALEAKKSQEVY